MAGERERAIKDCCMQKMPLMALVKDSLEHVKNKSASTVLWRRLTSASPPSNAHQENPQLNKGKYRDTDESVSWWGVKNSWLLRWAESRTHLQWPLWKGNNSLVLQIKLGCTVISVRCVVAGAAFGISPKSRWLESELQESKAISNVWHEVQNQWMSLETDVQTGQVVLFHLVIINLLVSRLNWKENSANEVVKVPFS